MNTHKLFFDILKEYLGQGTFLQIKKKVEVLNEEKNNVLINLLRITK